MREGVFADTAGSEESHLEEEEMFFALVDLIVADFNIRIFLFGARSESKVCRRELRNTMKA
jgi:hypothetical protein